MNNESKCKENRLNEIVEKIDQSAMNRKIRVTNVSIFVKIILSK